MPGATNLSKIVSTSPLDLPQIATKFFGILVLMVNTYYSHPEQDYILEV